MCLFFSPCLGEGISASAQQVALSTGAILGIIIAVFFIFLIIVDIRSVLGSYLSDALGRGVGCKNVKMGESWNTPPMIKAILHSEITLPFPHLFFSSPPLSPYF